MFFFLKVPAIQGHPNVHPQILGAMQRYETKMPRNCFSGLDVEMLVSCFGIHAK